MAPSDGHTHLASSEVKLKAPTVSPTLRRSQFAIVVVLTPNNDTFERKSLVVPFHPDVLKLGRQTNARTAASPDNGYFDSRVLSRQHAELWADRESGKVWLKDCRSSNGTYINQQRLSGENKESDAFELQQGDIIDLGIDISSDDDSLVYQKISATVARISTVPLHIKPINTSVSGPMRNQTEFQSAGSRSRLQLSSVKSGIEQSATRDSASNSLATVYGVSATSLNILALNHSRNTVNSLPSKAEVLRNVEFELASKRLAQEVKEARLNLAKLNSIKSMLEDIKRHQAQAPSLASTALRAENERLRCELNALSGKLTKIKVQELRPAPPISAGRQNLDKIVKASDINNMVLLLSSSALMVITGIGIMALFNPPE